MRKGWDLSWGDLSWGNGLVFDGRFGSHYNNGGTEVARFHFRIIESDPTHISVPCGWNAA